MRVSAIGNATDVLSPHLGYSAHFLNRWTDKTLDSQVFQISAEGTTVNVGGVAVPLKLPAPGSGVTGLLIADPCTSSFGGFLCPNGDRMRVREKLNKLVNQLVGSDEFHYWGLLGDNFYDTFGAISSEFFEHISTAAKAKPFMTVPGNHDFWQVGYPVKAPGDQYGWGFLQFYGQDTVAGQGTPPFDFAGNVDAKEIPKAENFIFGTEIGDTAFFGYSGAHEWVVTEPHARAFCQHVGKAAVNTVVILGHWNYCNLGCAPFMDTPGVWWKMRNMSGCSQKKMLYFDGHEHCNQVTGHERGEGPLHATGFMLGGAGMYGNGCSQFGFAVVQSDPEALHGANTRVDYFKLSEDMSWGKDSKMVEDHFDAIYNCFRQHGYAGCRKKYAYSFRAIPEQYDCTNATDWDRKWPPEQKKWCCENENIGCGGCDSKCAFDLPDTCREKLAWQQHLSKHSRTGQSCKTIHSSLLEQCVGCSSCHLSEACPGQEERSVTDGEQQAGHRGVGGAHGLRHDLPAVAQKFGQARHWAQSANWQSAPVGEAVLLGVAILALSLVAFWSRRGLESLSAVHRAMGSWNAGNARTAGVEPRENWLGGPAE